MKNNVIALCIAGLVSSSTFAQKVKEKDIPEPVRMALQQKYASAKKITWEKEKGNYEANWGGKSGEEYSVQFTPAGDFIEMVKAIPVGGLPKTIVAYVKEHYSSAKITEAGKITDAKNKTFYEVEVNKKDLIFDVNGIFVKAEK